MKIGVTKEIKPQENRIAMTPSGTDTLVRAGHKIFIERSGGVGSGFSDEEYISAGAVILSSAREVFDTADMIMKVKEPLAAEYDLFHEGQVLFAFLHLAPDRAQTEALLRKKVIGIAYETVQQEDGTLPLLAPMSEVAGRMSVQVGASLLEKKNGGSGILLGGVPGVEPARVVIIGGGVAGGGAARIAVGMGAQVTILDTQAARLSYLDDLFKGRVVTMMSNTHNIENAVKNADFVISSVLIAGAKAPKLVKEYMVKQMRRGSVVADIAIDQGGSVETMDRVTTHDKPFFIKHGVIHYSVANIPGAVPRTSTFALTNVTLPYAMSIADRGVEQAMRDDPALMRGLNVYKGEVTCLPVAEALSLAYTPVRDVLHIKE